MLRLFLIFVMVGFYAHLYVHFIVNPNNEFTTVKEINKEEISNSVYTKLPFVLGSGMNGNNLLEPYVRFVSSRKTYSKKKWSETHPACRTFYRILSGTYAVECIHPKYKELIEHKTLLKQNTQILRTTLREGEVLFVPNYWVVQFKAIDECRVELSESKDSEIKESETKSETKDSERKESSEKGSVERIEYFTPLNQLSISIQDSIGKFFK